MAGGQRAMCAMGERCSALWAVLADRQLSVCRGGGEGEEVMLEHFPYVEAM